MKARRMQFVRVRTSSAEDKGHRGFAKFTPPRSFTSGRSSRSLVPKPLPAMAMIDEMLSYTLRRAQPAQFSQLPNVVYPPTVPATPLALHDVVDCLPPHLSPHQHYRASCSPRRRSPCLPNLRPGCDAPPGLHRERPRSPAVPHRIAVGGERPATRPSRCTRR
jgi:hypothetical protein